MADQLARGLHANFSQEENPFGIPNGMDENLRILDDHLALYTVDPPVAAGTPLPSTPAPGDGQIYTDGTYAVFNDGSWRFYPPRRGIRATLLNGTEVWSNTGSGWAQHSVLDTGPATAIALAAQQAAQLARDAAILASALADSYPNGATANVPRGLTQASVGAITPGSGGTNGTFALGWSGGNFTHNPTGTFTVAGGVLTAVTITGPGLYIGAAPTVPTPSFAASSGLTGAAVALTAQLLIAAGKGYWVQSSDGFRLDRYKNVGGVATSDVANVKSILVSGGTQKLMNDRIARSTTKQRNLFDKTAVLMDTGIVASTGATTSSTNFRATDYILVTPGTSLVSSQNSYTLSGTGLAWYDQDQVYISGTTTILTAGVPITVPVGASFVRITYQFSANLNTLMICNDATLPTNYKGFNEPDLFPWLTAGVAATRANRLQKFNMFDPSGMKLLTKLNTATGAEIADSGGAFLVTNYMPVEPGVPFVTRPALAAMTNRVCAFYDKDKNVIQVISATATGWPDGQVFTPPTGAVYCRFCLATFIGVGFPVYWPQGEASLFLALPSTVAAGHLHTHTPATLSDLRPWSGRDSVALGDSLSVGSSSWTYQLAAHLGCTHIQHGANGRRMFQALLYENGTPLSAADFAGKSYCTFLLGSNDGAQSTPLGTIADLPPSVAFGNSFYGNLRRAIETLIGWNGNMRIVLCTPIYNTTLDVTPNGQGLLLEAYRVAIRNVAEMYGLPLLDFRKVSQLNAVNAGTWLTDGTHPSAAGYTALMANPAKAFFQSLWPLV